MDALIETEIACPHCGAPFSITIDTSQGDHETIEDCAVCCRPIQLKSACEPGALRDLAVLRE